MSKETKATAAKAKKASSKDEKSPATERKGTVHRVVDILSALASVQSDIGVGELAKQVDLPFPTTHRLLHLLKTEGIVTWNEESHRYSIGPELLRISCRVQSSFNVINLAEKYLNRIKGLTGETVIFGLYLPNSLSMSFVSTVSGEHPLQYRFEMNSNLSLIYGASGKSILAYLSDEEVEQVYEKEQGVPQNGAEKPSIESVKSEIERIRANGFAATESEKLVGARGIAAPIFDASGIFGCFCITCPKERIPLDRVAEFSGAVKEAAIEFSHTLGDKSRAT